MLKLGIVVKSKDKKEMHKVEANSFEDTIIKEEYYKIKQEHPESNLFIVSVLLPIPPEDNQSGGEGKYYCPFCGEYREFIPSEKLNLERCEICGISTNHFHVKKYNPSLAGR